MDEYTDMAQQRQILYESFAWSLTDGSGVPFVRRMLP